MTNSPPFSIYDVIGLGGTSPTDDVMNEQWRGSSDLASLTMVVKDCDD